MEKFQRKIDNPYKIARKIAPFLLALLFALTACGNYAASPIPTNIPPTTELPDLSHSIMGIIFSKDFGNVICVATAVGKNTAVTARHCTDDIITKAITIVLPNNEKHVAAITQTEVPQDLLYVDYAAIKYLTRNDLPLTPARISSQPPSNAVVCTTLSFDKYGNAKNVRTVGARSNKYDHVLITASGPQFFGLYNLILDDPSDPVKLISGSPCVDQDNDKNKLALIRTNGSDIRPLFPLNTILTAASNASEKYPLQKLVDALK